MKLWILDFVPVNSEEYLRDDFVKVFKNGPSKICGRQPLKKFTWSILIYLDPNGSRYS